ALIPDGFPAVADPVLCLAIRDTAKALGFTNTHFGVSLSLAAFYPSPAADSTLLKNAAAGAIAVEMENAALFVVATLRGIRAAAVATVDGSPLKWDDGDYDPHGQVVKEGKDRMIKTGLEAAKRIVLENL
ncbi:hypothetical protein FOZ62_014851, partial [Perkinsus olseni]